MDTASHDVTGGLKAGVAWGVTRVWGLGSRGHSRALMSGPG